MRIAIIPARGGSKRIKNKNIIDFFGKPLIAYALDAAKESGLFDKIHVSTDSEEIKSTVEELGYKVDFMRPDNLADDFTGLIPVLKWVHEEYKKKGQFFDEVCCIMPTAPLLESRDLVEGFELFHKHNCKDPLLVAAPYPVPIEWAFFRHEDTHLEPRNLKFFSMRSQDIKPAFYEAGPFLILNPSHLQKLNLFDHENFLSLLVDKSRAVDIDDPEDLELAKVLYLGKLALIKSLEQSSPKGN